MSAPLSVKEAGLYARRHPETISEALRGGELHGNQRVKGGTWSIREACLDAWIDGVDCPHKLVAYLEAA